MVNVRVIGTPAAVAPASPKLERMSLRTVPLSVRTSPTSSRRPP
jgi:hypothetical protein